MKFSHLTLSVALLTVAVSAQTQLVRGDIDSIQGTNRFALDCTAQQVELVSNTVNLQQLHNQSRQQNIEYAMQVLDVSTPNQKILNVVSATVIPEMLDMGNLRFGRNERWEVFGQPGSRTWTYINLASATRYFPFGAAGAWLFGDSAVLLRQGTTSALGSFQFRFQMPTIPALIGVEITAQSLIVQPNNALIISNPDCKDVRS